MINIVAQIHVDDKYAANMLKTMTDSFEAELSIDDYIEHFKAKGVAAFGTNFLSVASLDRVDGEKQTSIYFNPSGMLG